MLRAQVECLTSQNEILRARLSELGSRKPYAVGLRLKIVWHMEYFRIPRRRIRKHLGIPRGTLYRWLHRFEGGELAKRQKAEPANKTPTDLACLIWEMFRANPHWGRRRIAMTIQALGTFIAASTVRNILIKRRPRMAPMLPAMAAVVKTGLQAAPRQVAAYYPNHVWSADRTRVYRWGVWPIWVLVAIDHFSRKLVLVSAPKSNDGDTAAEALQNAFVSHGTPKHLITDREGIFKGQALQVLLERSHTSHRLGAIGKSGSISVTERAIWTLKYEWLRRVPLIRGPQHLSELLADFAGYYNEWRSHTTLRGATPESRWVGRRWMAPERSQKTLPSHVERRLFPEVGITAYRPPGAGLKPG